MTLRARLADPSPEDYAVAAELQRTAEEAGVGLAVLFAMVLRGLGCEIAAMRREDPRVRRREPER